MGGKARRKSKNSGGEPGTDPYATLGIDVTATKDQIKKAYYDLAKQHHPDAGGENDDFLPVKLAYETLIDDEKRAFFDTFGAIPGSDEAQEMQAASQGLGQMFLELLMQTSPEGLRKLDVVGRLRQRLESERSKNEQNLKLVEQRESQLIATIEVLTKRLVSTDPKQPNIFLQSVQSALEQCAAQRLTVTSGIAVQGRALEILKNFTFDFDKEPEKAFTGFSGYSGIFTSTTRGCKEDMGKFTMSFNGSTIGVIQTEPGSVVTVVDGRVQAEVKRRDMHTKDIDKALTELLEMTYGNGQGLWGEQVVGAIRAHLAELEGFVRDVRDNWDCDSDAHRYDTSCRCCMAAKLLPRNPQRKRSTPTWPTSWRRHSRRWQSEKVLAYHSRSCHPSHMSH